MKKGLVYLLGIITGIILTCVFVFFNTQSDAPDTDGLEMFEKPGECMEYTQFNVFQVVESGCALARADDLFGAIVCIIPSDNQQFYDDQEIVLKNGQCAQRVGTYKYNTRMEITKTVPVVRIIDGVKQPKTNKTAPVNTKEEVNKKDNGITLFDKPGDCVSRKDFEVQKVLESGDAIALEIRDMVSDIVLTSNLEVLILAQEDSNFYNNQIIKTPKGKCAIQIGNYKYKEYSNTKVIPIIAFQ